MSRPRLALPLIVIAAFSAWCEPATPPAKHYWKPTADEVYLQEDGTRIVTEKPVTALAVSGQSVFGVIDGALYTLDKLALVKRDDAPSGILRLRALDGALWAATEKAVFRSVDGRAWQEVFDKPMVDFCVHLGKVHGATRDAIFRFDDGKFVDIKPASGYLSSDSTVVMADGSQVLADPVRISPVERIASYSGTLYLLRPGGLALLDRGKFVPSPIDWGAIPSDTTRALLSQGGCLYIATDQGIAELRGMAMTTLNGASRLPYHDTTCLTEGFDGDLWIGTTKGAIRKTNGDYQYFGAEHWLPGDNVHDIAVVEHTVYIATDAGLGVIRYEPFTLAKKAAYYDRELDEWGHKRLGFIHQLYWDDSEKAWLREISDNDGGNSAEYLAAMSFKYAVTGDEKARAAALDTFEAMIWLDAITPSDGFIARAIWSVKADKGHRADRGSGGLPAKWYDSPDGLFQWKGDTSSDEVNGHMYAVALFHDLAAKGKEKDRAAAHIALISNHILTNGWVLRDMDGKPTRWGQWGPEYLFTNYGFDARGLNGMEAQTYMITAKAMTGDSRFDEGMQQLIKWGYPNFTVRQKLTFPPDLVVTWDDELAFRCYHPLLTYTTDPDLRSVYLRSLERSWEVMRREHVPLFNFMYGALTGNDCEVDRATQFLRDFPLDCTSYRYRNSFRDDLAPEPGYPPYTGTTRGLSPRETEAKWGSQSALELNGGSGGRSVTPPIGWLQAYWMGRYYGFIKAPTAKDDAVLTVPTSSGEKHGAAPYDGPPRPGGLIDGPDADVWPPRQK